MESRKDLIEKNQVKVFECVENKTLIDAHVQAVLADIMCLEEDLRKAKTISEKSSLLSALSKLKSFIAFMNGMRDQEQRGEGLQGNVEASINNEQYIIWEDLPSSAFSKRIRTAVITNLAFQNLKEFLKESVKLLMTKLKDILEEYSSVKINAVFCGEFKKPAGNYNDEDDDDAEQSTELKHLNTKNVVLYKEEEGLEKILNDGIIESLLKKFEEFQERNSGWALSAIINLLININKHTPMIGSAFIRLPQNILRKKAIVNVQNNDNACFAWAVLSALYPVERHSNRPSSYPDYHDVLNLDNVTFPMQLNKIHIFENNNNLSINVFIYHKEPNEKLDIYPVRLSNFIQKDRKHINLLLLQEYAIDDNTELINQHFVWIKNFSRLIGDRNSHHSTKFICDRCLHYFYDKEKLEIHQEDCLLQNNCKVRLPSLENKILSFKNYRNKIMSPYVIYADIECVLKEIKISSNNNNNNSNKVYQEHIPCSVGYLLKCSFQKENVDEYKAYRGINCIEWFMNELNTIEKKISNEVSEIIPIEMTHNDQIDFDNANYCHICQKPFSMLTDYKVRDHCHFTGKYRGASHNSCNLNFKEDLVIPVFFHNLSSYDAHFIIKEIHKIGEGNINVLPINKEKYISFTKYINNSKIKFRFLDSFRFLPASLDSLCSQLDKFPILESEYSNLTQSQLKLLKRKGIFPYDYIDSFDKFSENSLPEKIKFYNKLNETHISDDDYCHAKKIWDEFKIENLGEYSDLYLKVDVLLLAEIFEQFRVSSMKTHKLDPSHYYTLPGYTWDAMLLYTGVELELLTDIDMLMFIERGIRGGLTQCTKRYSEANNKYMRNYDSSKPVKYLMYWDINNQYGYAMTQYLPKGNFEWVKSIDNFTEEKILALPNDSPKGYIFEVNLEYPRELHNLHSDLPFCPENMCPPGSKQKKLLANLFDKTKYIIHYRNLRQALENGLKLGKIWRILSFDQSPWLKPYIDLNTNLRAQATNDFQKTQYKLKNNATFGKTMENVRKYSTVKLVNKWEGRYGAKSLIASPFFKNTTIFNENLAAIELFKSSVYFCKPIYVGFSVLDISKTLNYDYHYNYMKPKYGNNCSILYTDTDSLVYEISNDNVYEMIREDCNLYYDTSDYPNDNIWKIPQVNKKIVGLMKDELNGKIMTHFVGLRAKMYSLKVENKEKIKKIKGIKKNVIKKKICFNDFVKCLNENDNKVVNQNLIRSNQHNVYSVTQIKLALSSTDDKRYILSNNQETLPWGHFLINQI